MIGVLQTLPRNAPAGSFEGYLANAGMNFRLNRGRVLALTRLPRRIGNSATTPRPGWPTS